MVLPENLRRNGLRLTQALPMAWWNSAFLTRGRSLVALTSISPIPFDRRSVAAIHRFAAHPFSINIVSFFILSFVAFRNNTSWLFYAYDGQFEVSLITVGSLFAPLRAGLTNDFFHGIGNVWFAVQPQLFPEYFFSLSRAGKFTNFALAYTISATQLFAGTYLIARLLGITGAAALIAAWIVPLLTFQFVGWHLIANTFRFFPHYATVAVLVCIVSVLVLLTGVSTSRKAALFGVVSFGIISYLVIATPTLLILGAPQFIVFGVMSLIAAVGRHQLIRTSAILGGIVVACVGLGYVTFLLGLTAYSAADFFRNLA